MYQTILDVINDARRHMNSFVLVRHHLGTEVVVVLRVVSPSRWVGLLLYISHEGLCGERIP